MFTCWYISKRLCTNNIYTNLWLSAGVVLISNICRRDETAAVRYFCFHWLVISLFLWVDGSSDLHGHVSNHKHAPAGYIFKIRAQNYLVRFRKKIVISLKISSSSPPAVQSSDCLLFPSLSPLLLFVVTVFLTRWPLVDRWVYSTVWRETVRPNSWLYEAAGDFSWDSPTSKASLWPLFAEDGSQIYSLFL